MGLTPAECLARPGRVHDEGACRCFTGGPAGRHRFRCRVCMGSGVGGTMVGAVRRPDTTTECDNCDGRGWF